MLMAYFDRYAAAYVHYKNGAWCYEDGCIYRGLELLHAVTGDERWFAHLKRLADMQISNDGTLAGYTIEEFNIDNILSGRALLYLYKRTGEEKYMAATRLLAEQLSQHPRTQSGVYWHKKIYPWQIWLDGLYMGPPFQIGFGQATGDEALVEDALRQLQTGLRLTHEDETGLFAHGYDESRDQKWADPTTGRSPAHWARALGWLAMALVDIAELIGLERVRETAIAQETDALLERVLAWRTEGAMWLQVIDRPDLDGNYAESSATAMFSYALIKAERLGLLAEGARKGRESLDALRETALERGRDGKIRLGGICHVAGLGGRAGAYRDGTPKYYLKEPIVADDAKGVGPLMMAVAEDLRTASAYAEPTLSTASAAIETSAG